MNGHISYTFRRIVNRHCQLDLHYVQLEVKDLHLNNIFMLLKMIENVNILFILVLRFQIVLLKQYSYIDI